MYGKTKLDGEIAILSIMKFDALIIRASWIYSEYGNNFVDTILKLSQKKDKLNIIRKKMLINEYDTLEGDNINKAETYFRNMLEAD